jgi:hypothetical protein
MPSRDRLRPLKAWRYVGVYGPELMLCVCSARVGRARQAFWAVWDRERRMLRERTSRGRGGVDLRAGRIRVLEPGVQLDLSLREVAGIETVCRTADSYAWTRKQGGIEARGTVNLDGDPRRVAAHGIVDDTAAYYERHTQWRWSAGVGHAVDGRSVAWNLVEGVNDPAEQSERTVWMDGQPHEVSAVRFADDLSAVDGLRFHAEAGPERRENLLLVRSFYRQPFGTFSGTLPGGMELREGYGVIEHHDVWW